MVTEPTSTGLQIVRACAASLGSMIVAVVVAMTWLFWLGSRGWVPLALPIGAAAGAIGLWRVLIRGRGWAWEDLGFRRFARNPLHLVWQVPLAVAASAAGAALLGRLIGIAPGKTDATASDVNLIADNAFRPLMIAVVAMSTIIVIPAIEEIVFRRLLFGWLRERMPLAVAVIASGVIFAACHIMPATMIYIVWLGMFMALLYVRYRTLWAPLALHMANNALVTYIALTA